MSITNPQTASAGMSLILRATPFAVLIPAVLLFPFIPDDFGSPMLLTSLELAALLSAIGCVILRKATDSSRGKQILIFSASCFGLTFVRGFVRWCGMPLVLGEWSLLISSLATYLLGMAGLISYLRPVMEELQLVSFSGTALARWRIRYYLLVTTMIAAAGWTFIRPDARSIHWPLVADGSSIPLAAIGLGELFTLIAGLRINSALQRRSQESQSAITLSNSNLAAGGTLLVGVAWLFFLSATILHRWPDYPRHSMERMLSCWFAAASAWFGFSVILSGVSDLLRRRLGVVVRVILGGLFLFAAFCVVQTVVASAGKANPNNIPRTKSVSIAKTDDELLRKFHQLVLKGQKTSATPIKELWELKRFTSDDFTELEMNRLEARFDVRFPAASGIAQASTAIAVGKKFKRGESDWVLFQDGRVEQFTADAWNNLVDSESKPN